jgi:hypothetical protein
MFPRACWSRQQTREQQKQNNLRPAILINLFHYRYNVNFPLFVFTVNQTSKD